MSLHCHEKETEEMSERLENKTYVSFITQRPGEAGSDLDRGIFTVPLPFYTQVMHKYTIILNKNTF